MYFNKKFWYGLIGFILLIVLVLPCCASARIVTSEYGYSLNPLGYDHVTSSSAVSYDYNGNYISSVSFPPKQKSVSKRNYCLLERESFPLKSETINFVNGLNLPLMESSGTYYYLDNYQLEEFNTLRIEAGGSRYYNNSLPFFWVKDLKKAASLDTYELKQKLRENPY